MPGVRTVKLFLASSSELESDRRDFEVFINHENKRLIKKNIFIELVIWEDFIDQMSKTRIQAEYNKAIIGCDIFVLLFFRKVGKYTLEEFETAFGQFIATGKPAVYTFFKDAPVNTGDIRRDDVNSLLDFQDKLKALGHFQTTYPNTDSLLLQFKRQLEYILEQEDGRPSLSLLLTSTLFFKYPGPLLLMYDSQLGKTIAPISAAMFVELTNCMATMTRVFSLDVEALMAYDEGGGRRCTAGGVWGP
jgi:hypothetical protein